MMLHSYRLFSLLFFPLSFLFVLLFEGCMGPDHSKRVEKVDSLQQVSKELWKRIEEVDTARALEIKGRLEEELRIFKQHYERDSMGEKLYQTLDEHKNTQKALEGYKSLLFEIKKRSKKSREQLEALKKDLRKGHYTAEKAEGYIEDEKKVLEQIEGSVQKLEERTEAAIKNYRSYSGSLRKRSTLPDSVEWPGEEKQ